MSAHSTDGYEFSFVQKTIKNLELIQQRVKAEKREGKKDCEIQDAFEVTQLINSFVGLLIKRQLVIILCVTLILGMSTIGTFAEEVAQTDAAEITEDIVIEGEASEEVEFVIEQTESSSADEMYSELITESEVASEEETVFEENNNAVLEECEEDGFLLEYDEEKYDYLENEESIVPTNRDLVIDDFLENEESIVSANRDLVLDDFLENEESIVSANRDLALDDLGIATVEAEERIPVEDVPARKEAALLSNASDDLIDVGTGTNRFYYNDKMLFDNIGNTTPSGEISLASVGLTVAAYDQKTIEQTLSQMGFSSLFVSKYYSNPTTRNNNDVIAYSIADKYVNYNDKIYRIIVVPIRGTPSTCEWYSNFDIRTGRQHYGFYTAASYVLGNISAVLNDSIYNVDHTIIWTMGHSRGAAVANIVAGEISTGSGWQSFISKDYVFGYTYACPAVSLDADTSLYNIFNYNNGGDVVPALPLADWGFKRFGQTIELPASDYDNLCQRFKAENSEDYSVGMTTVAWEDLLKQIAPTRDEFVNNDKIQLAVDILSWYLGGITDGNYGLLKVVLDHPSANVEITGSVLKTALFPKSTLQRMASDIAVADLQIMLDSDLRQYVELETKLMTAISDTAEMSDIDSEDEETHRKYLEWCNWKVNNSSLIYEAEDMTNIVIESKADLVTAHSVAVERNESYKDIVSTIQRVISLFYDTEGNFTAAFSQGHIQQTYELWVNSMYYGYKGWYGNPDITVVNWAGRDQRTYVGDYCFSNCNKINSVTCSFDNLIVGAGAFEDCNGLTKVTLSGDDWIVGNCSFRHCSSLSDLVFSGENGIVEEFAFAGCGLTELVIPDSIDRIGSYAFYECPIETLTAPYDPDCYVLTLMDGYNSLPRYTSFDSCPIKKLTITKGKTDDYYDTDVYYDVDLANLHRFGPWDNSTITHLKVEEGVKGLDRDFLDLPYLKEIELPSSLEHIKVDAFRDADGDGLPNDLKVIYHGNLITWFNIDFEGSSANPLSVKNSHFIIENEDITNIVIPNGIKKIKKYAFYNCSDLISLNVPSTVTEIEDAAFCNCENLTDVIINEETTIGNSAFANCKNLKRVNLIGDNITIGGFAFDSCSSLTELVIPESINKVGDSAFRDCSIENLKAPYDPSCYEKNTFVFYGCPLKNLTITKGKTGDYYDTDLDATHIWWSSYYVTHVRIEEGVQGLGEQMFQNFPSLEEIELPSTLKHVNYGAFSFHDKIYPGLKVVYHGDAASWCNIDFEGDSSNPLFVKESTFYIGDQLVTDFIAPESVKEIKAFAFRNYDCLKSIIIPRGVVSIGYCAFHDCNGITDVYYTGSEAEWKSININDGNSPIQNAAIHYSYKADDKTDITNWTVTGINNLTYTGSPLKQSKIRVSNAGEYAEFTAKYKNNINVGTAIVTITGKGDYIGTIEKTFQVLPKSITPVVALSKTSYTYDGKTKKPLVTVKDGNVALDTSAYTVSYASGRKSVGTYKATVTLKGNYKGSASSSFKIVRAKNNFTKVTTSKSIKLSNLKKKNQTFTIAATVKEKAKKTFKLKSVPKKAQKYISVSNAGKMTVKKGLEKGTYSVKVQITAAKTKNYKKTTVTKTIKVIVK